MEQRLEEGKEYRRLDGLAFKVMRRYLGGNVYCSDGWNRFGEGPNIGKFCGQEKDPNFSKHIDPKCLFVPVYKHRQLTLL